MRLILVRHGQTEANARGLIQGGGMDGPLNDVGILQAHRTADKLKNETIHHAYSSDLVRAKHTAEEILKHHPRLNLTTTAALREKHAGQYEGKPKITVDKTKSLKRASMFKDFTPDGGESFATAQKRVLNFYAELCDKHTGETVLAVAHGGIIAALLMHLFDKPVNYIEYDNLRPENGAITILEVTDKPLLVLHNERAHLMELQSLTPGDHE